jgi:hypothetical protein
MQSLPLDAIRQAVAAEEYERAQLLWTQCAARIDEDLRSGHLTAARLNEVRMLVEWSRTAALCARAHMQDQLNSLHVAGEYEPAPPRPVHRLVETSF